MNENMLPIGTVLRAGTYIIEGQISAGGFENTYVVRNLSFDEVYAMKEFFMKGINLRNGSDVTVSIPSNKATFEFQRDKFKKEAIRLRKLANPHIVKVHDLFEENGTVYYVMDLIDDRTLNDTVKSDGPMDESKATDIYRQMLDYSLDDIEHYGISIFSYSSNSRFPIYYRGYTYSGDDIGIYGLKTIQDLEESFENVKSRIQKVNSARIDFETYIRNNEDNLASSFNIITYCSESDLLRVLLKIKQNPAVFGKYRIIQEMQLVPLCFYGSRDDSTIAYEYPKLYDSAIAYEYQQLYCEAGFGGSLVEILQSGFLNEKADYTEWSTIRRLSGFEGFAFLLLGSFIQYQIIDKAWTDDALLLAAFPFDIQIEIWMNGRYRDGFKLIERNISIPSKIYKTISDDNCSIVILFLGKRFSLDVNDLFHYKPKSIEFSVDIDANTNIKYTLNDKEMNKEISISQIELFNYEVNNTIYE